MLFTGHLPVEDVAIKTSRHAGQKTPSDGAQHIRRTTVLRALWPCLSKVFVALSFQGLLVALPFQGLLGLSFTLNPAAL
jgi:hypothetical protein